jgi:predicted AAA+ superfamily ATPase
VKRFPVIPNYIKRSLETVVKKALSEFPAAVLTDPRQSGKTTLLKAIFGRKFDYVPHPLRNRSADLFLADLY